MAPGSERPSKIFLEELFAAEDPRFLQQFRRFEEYHVLKHFTERWQSDARPWARDQLIAYIDGELRSPGHEVVVKRLFKFAEQQHDTQLLVHFMVAFDRLVRRVRVETHTYDWRTRQSHPRGSLQARSNRTLRDQPERLNRPGNRLFSQQTRAHLRRRVWRYFRYLSYRDPVAYASLMCDALVLYRDEDFAAGENLLDNWSLMHACYYRDPAIQFGPAHTNVTPGSSLANLSAAPYQRLAWQSESAGRCLWELLISANSTLVRMWAIELLKQEHAESLKQVELSALVDLLAHTDAVVQEFAVALFSQHAELPTLALEVWLQLIARADFAVLATICEAMKRHVDQQRLTDEQLLQMACARPTPVAVTGWQMLQARHKARAISPDLLIQLASARCESLAEEMSAWALKEISRAEAYRGERVIGFFDALSQPVRRAACQWLLADESPGRSDPALWAKLAETPWDEVRFALLELLQPLVGSTAAGRSAAVAGPSLRRDLLDSDAMGLVWSAVVLCVHRGSRAKPKAIRQLAAVIERQPAKAQQYLPVLAYAVRSIRHPERRAALAALSSLLARHPAIESDIERLIPELQMQAASSSHAGGDS